MLSCTLCMGVRRCAEKTHTQVLYEQKMWVQCAKESVCGSDQSESPEWICFLQSFGQLASKLLNNNLCQLVQDECVHEKDSLSYFSKASKTLYCLQYTDCQNPPVVIWGQQTREEVCICSRSGLHHIYNPAITFIIRFSRLYCFGSFGACIKSMAYLGSPCIPVFPIYIWLCWLPSSKFSIQLF